MVKCTERYLLRFRKLLQISSVFEILKYKNMDNTNIWEKEFPRLYKLRIPKTFFADLVVGLESKIRKLVFWGVIALMVYVIYYRFNQYFVTGDLSNLKAFPVKDDWALWTWKAYRNFFYLIMILDLVLVIPTSIIHVVRKQMPKVVKITYGWFLLLLFITFSYAIAGLLFDIGIIAITMNWNMLKQIGAPVGNPPFGFIPK